MERKFGFRDKIGYMFGDFGNDFFFMLASTFLMVFYYEGTRHQCNGGRNAVSGCPVCGRMY